MTLESKPRFQLRASIRSRLQRLVHLKAPKADHPIGKKTISADSCQGSEWFPQNAPACLYAGNHSKHQSVLTETKRATVHPSKKRKRTRYMNNQIGTAHNSSPNMLLVQPRKRDQTPKTKKQVCPQAATSKTSCSPVGSFPVGSWSTAEFPTLHSIVCWVPN